MRVKRFVGDNVAETMGKVKRDLGPDAVILKHVSFVKAEYLAYSVSLK